MNKTNLLSTCGVIALMAVTFALPINAAAIIEPIQEYRAAPGSIRTGYISVAFTPNDPNVMYLTVEKLDTDENNRQISVKAAPGENTLANWITLETNVVTKPQNAQYQNNDNVRRVGYTINIPANAEPGSDYAVIVASERNSATESNAVAISKDLTTSILFTVEGDTIEEADLIGFGTLNKQFLFSRLPVDFVATFKNNGNVHVIPRGNIEVFSGNSKIDNISLNPSQGRTLPNRTQTYNRLWSNENIEDERLEDKIKAIQDKLPKNFFEEVVYQIQNFRIGIYTADLQGFAGKRQIKGNVTFVVFPVHLALTVAGAGAALYFYRKRSKTKSSKRK